MPQFAKKCSSGLMDLDRVLQGLRPGDNVVWQVDSYQDYQPVVAPFCSDALQNGEKLIYFRFARHPELIAPDSRVETHVLNPEVGFETFTAEIHQAIQNAGRGAYYVFDCLSDLAADWCSDLMLGNFFMVTCPYLYELETITYFALFRNCHSFQAIDVIRGTTQLLIDIFRHKEKIYVHPLKVFQRHSPTMYLPHVWEGDTFHPLTESATLSEVLAEIAQRRTDSLSRTADIWEQRFLSAEEVHEGAKSGLRSQEEAKNVFQQLLRMTVTRDNRLFALAFEYLDLSDLLAIRRRMIGTGMIGGKAAGMLLAQAILTKRSEKWRSRLETHDSFYIGSDVFYTYLVRNQCWRARRDQRNTRSFLEGVDEARAKIQAGTFPEFIVRQFVAMLEYFGQSPIIVRSSSLLEDSFGNAFTGKYESVFCPSQGSPEDRLAAFLSAVQTIYASTMSSEALLYRSHRGLLARDEQMALLVQRVSGGVHSHLFYPQVAGVGLSYNPFAWSEYIEPKAGVLRIVLGLGTRAVERSDDDYTRIVALNAPLRRPEADFSEMMEYAQHRVDVMDLAANRFVSLSVDDVLKASPDLPREMFASRWDSSEPGRGTPSTARWVLTFDKLLSRTTFVADMREMLGTLQEAYDSPVDIEFTANFLDNGGYRINLVQCRPLQVTEGKAIVDVPHSIDPQHLVLQTCGPVIGHSCRTTIDRLIYVVPSVYLSIPTSERPSVARLIGRLTHLQEENPPHTIMLIGPGRWGTSMASLGVPVSFAEINTVSILCEIITATQNVVPSVSLGTHFFNDIVESDILFLSVDPASKQDILNENILLGWENQLLKLIPEEIRWADAVRVLDFPTADSSCQLRLEANSLRQEAACYCIETQAPSS